MRFSEYLKNLAKFFAIFLAFFTLQANAAIYDYDLSKFEFTPTNSWSLRNWVPTDMPSFTYRDWFSSWSSTFQNLEISSIMPTYRTYASLSTTSAQNYRSISPFFVVVDNFYYNSGSTFQIPIGNHYLDVEPIEDSNQNTCLNISDKQTGWHNKLENTCIMSDKYITFEPYILFFNVIEHGWFNSVTDVSFSQANVGKQNYYEIQYTASRRTWTSSTWSIAPISLYQIQSFIYDISQFYDNTTSKLTNTSLYSAPQIDIKPSDFWLPDNSFYYQIYKSFTTNPFKKINSNQQYRTYSHIIPNFPNSFLNSNTVQKIQSPYIFLLPTLPVSETNFLDEYAPAVLTQIYWPPTASPEFHNVYTGNPNNPLNPVDWRLQLIANPLPTPPQCTFTESFLGLSCLGQWINYGFQLVKYSFFSLINTLISAINKFFDFFDWIKNFFEWILNFIKDPFSIFPKIWFSWYTDTCGNDYTKNGWNTAFSSTGWTTQLSFAQNLANVVSIAIPFAPADNSTICTFSGSYKVDYKDNTKFLDTIFVMFSFTAIIFTLISWKPND